MKDLWLTPSIAKKWTGLRAFANRNEFLPSTITVKCSFLSICRVEHEEEHFSGKGKGKYVLILGGYYNNFITKETT